MNDKEVSTIKALIPSGLETGIEGPADFKDLPHVQRLAVLVYFFLLTRERFGQERNQKLGGIASGELERLRQEEPQKLVEGFSLFEHLLSNTEWGNIYVDESRVEIPKILDEKISKNGDIFGFGELTRPILEMAHDMYETELMANMTTFEPGHFPSPTGFFEHVLFRMLTEGSRSGSSIFSETKYPAGRFYDKIFTREVSGQLQSKFEEYSRRRSW